ncbi:13057_t:CDS:1, partial [Gigaspora margarita]
KAISAIFSQKDNQDKEKVISYASRTLTVAEINYSVTEQECLVVIW